MKQICLLSFTFDEYEGTVKKRCQNNSLNLYIKCIHIFQQELIYQMNNFIWYYF